MRYPSLQAVELTKAQIPEGRIKDYLIATASCFPAFPVYEFDGQQYIDGGYQGQPADRAGAEDGRRPGDRRESALSKSDPSDAGKAAAGRRDFPSRELGSFLSFDPELLKRNRELGLLDARKFLGQLIGERFVFSPLNASLRALAERMLRELTLFQCQLDDSDHPFIDTLWPQNVLLDRVLKIKGDTAETVLVRMMENGAEFMKKTPDAP